MNNNSRMTFEPLTPRVLNIHMQGMHATWPNFNELMICNPLPGWKDGLGIRVGIKQRLID